MSETQEQITAEELNVLAARPKMHGGPGMANALQKAATTIRALTVRAGKAERELCEARRELVGTRADQRTAETCARRLEAELTLAQTAASELRLQRDEAKATADNWQELLVGATKHLSDAEQERDAARAELAALRAKDCLEYGSGDPGGYPTREALEAAATWAEEHPAKQEPVPCTCGHKHAGCGGCAHIRLAWDAEPCVGCIYGQDGPQECQYDPAPLMCEHCGKPRRDADE